MLAGASVDICGGDGADMGGGAVIALLGLRRGQASDAVACAVRLHHRAKVGEGQRHLRAHPWTSAAVTALAGGGEAVLALLCSPQGWAANASACPACLRPRVEVRGGQRLLPAAFLVSQFCNL